MKKRKQIKVESFAYSEDGCMLPPGIFYYPNGVPPDDSKQFGTLFSSNTSNQFTIIQSGENSKVALVGSNIEPEENSIPTTHCMGVFTNRSRSLKLLPILSDAVVRMDPKIEGKQYDASDAVTVARGLTEFQKQISGNIKTMSTFAGNQTKNRLKTAERGRFDVQSLASRVTLESIAEGISAQAREDGLTTEQVYELSSSERNLPPYHSDATTAEEAYVFDEICPGFMKQYLDTDKLMLASQDEMMEMELRRNAESRFVMNQLAKIKTVENQVLSHALAERLAFLSSLLKLNRLATVISRRSNTFQDQIAEEYGFHPDLCSFLLSIFCEHRESKGQHQYRFPDSKKRLLHYYILVIAFLINDSELESDNLETLRHELGLIPKALTKVLQGIGAKVSGKPQGTEGWNAKLLKNKKSLADNLPKLSQTSSRRSRR